MEDYLILMLIIATGLALADLAITARNLEGGGKEYNPLFRFAFEKLGVWSGGILLKAAMMAVAVAISIAAVDTPLYGILAHILGSLFGFITSYLRR